MITTAGRSSPQPGTGRPQYCSRANARRLVTATSSRHSTRRGHARQTDCLATRSVSDSAPAASPRTASALVATGVPGIAGSPGHPLPGATGPVMAAWALVTGDAVEYVVLAGHHLFEAKPPHDPVKYQG